MNYHPLTPAGIRYELDRMGWSYPPELNDWLVKMGFDLRALNIKRAVRQALDMDDIAVREYADEPGSYEVRVRARW